MSGTYNASHRVFNVPIDSRSAIQHLTNRHNVRDRTGTDILNILKRLSLSRQIHFQRIPPYVNIAGNEIADSLARAGAGETTMSATPFTYLELFQSIKQRIKPFG
ncbi:RNase H domain-containing protein [Trichonephila clavipes]|nr:RNase H domain-containing protein [Trichonephila clavipes]